MQANFHQIASVPGTMHAQIRILSCEARTRSMLNVCAGEDSSIQENTMRKILLVNLAAAAVMFSAGALLPNRADATMLGAAAGLPFAAGAVNPTKRVERRRSFLDEP